MGVFSRLGEILNANLNSMLESAENPEKMARLMICEMEDTLTEIKSSAAEVIADRIRLERERGTCGHRASDWEGKAALALSKNREDLAREALEQKLLYEQQAGQLGKRLEELERVVRQYQTDIGHLEEKLQAANRRLHELLLRKRELENRRKVEEQIMKVQTQGAFAKYEHYEQKLDRLQADLELRTRGEEDLELKFRDLEHSSQIEAELERMRQKAKPSGGK